MANTFATALSSLKAHSAAVDTVGNNLANVNTTGFKATEVAFKDLVAESLNARSEAGMGVGRPMTIRHFTQGAVQSTSGPLDAAIQGSGFFVAKSASGEELYTRDGAFTADSDGNLVTLSGEKVQQLKNSQLQDIKIPTSLSTPAASTRMSVTANLDSGAVVGQPSGTFSTPVEVVDSLGVKHVLTVNYVKTGAAAWTATAYVNGSEVTPVSATPVAVGNVNLTFDSAGKLLTPAAPGTTALAVNGLASGAANMSVAYSLYDTAGTPVISQYAGTSVASEVSADGAVAANLASVGMTDGGVVMARYTNGENIAVGTLAMAMLTNPSSLTSAGNNFYRVSSESAQRTLGIAESGGRGKIKAGALEGSTVDIAREFTNLIVYQRGYQANSRVITTADELSQETLNLKR